MEGVVDDGGGGGGFRRLDLGGGLFAFPWRRLGGGGEFADFRRGVDERIKSGEAGGGTGSRGDRDGFWRGLGGCGLWFELFLNRGRGGLRLHWRGGLRLAGWSQRSGGDEIRAAGEDLDDVGDANFAERLDRLDDAEFEMQALVGRPFHPAFRLGENVDGGEDAVGRVFVGGLQQGGPESGGDALAVGGRVEFRDQQGAQAADEFAEELREFAAAFGFLLDEREGGGVVAGEQGLREGGDFFAGGETENIEHVGLVDRVAAEGDELVEHRLGVAHAAVGALGDGPGGGFFEGDAFLAGDVEQVLRNRFRRDRPQVEALAAGEDGGQDLVRLGGGEDEFHVRRWFFERLEQRVEGGVREHVDLVDVENLELPAGGGEAHGLAQVADLLDAVVRGTVDFEHVERATFGNLDADVLLGVEVGFRAVGAVERLGENPRGGGLPGAPRADEKIGVGQPFLGDGVAKGPDDVVLSEDVVEGFGSVFAGEDLITHGGECRDGGGFVMAEFSGIGKMLEWLGEKFVGRGLKDAGLLLWVVEHD